MKTTTRLLFAALSVITSAGCGAETTGATGTTSGGSTGGASDVAPDITGHWVSTSVETRNGAGGSKLYVRRDFQTKATTSAARFDFFEDVEGTKPSLSVWLNGPYQLEEAWSAVPGSFAGEFTFAELKLTPKSQAMADFLNSAAPGTCGSEAWKPGVEQDATASKGCSVLGLDLVNKATEYDIVKLDAGKLYYGARPEDGSGLDAPEKRPTALQPPLARGN